MGRFTWFAYLQVTIILTVLTTVYWFVWRSVDHITGPFEFGAIGLYLLTKTWMTEE